MEQCWRDLLQTTWDLKGDNDEFQRRLPGGELIRINAPCCNQFLLSREVVRRRPLHVWMDLLNMIGVREVCHEGELDYDNLWSYHRWGMVSGPEPATYFVTTPIGNAKPQEGTISHHQTHICTFIGALWYVARWYHCEGGEPSIFPCSPSLLSLCV
jgi:hypothetical protein